jgi:1-deoxy-D-xylulose-5-phosphate synthase
LALALNNPTTIAHYDFAFVKTLDEKELHSIFKTFKTIITIEDGLQKVVLKCNPEFAKKTTIPKKITTDEFIEHGTVDELQEYCKIDVKV